MKYIEKQNLLNKYVLFNDFYRKSNLIITPKTHLFIIKDIIFDPDDLFYTHEYALQSVKINNFELWAKIGQIIVLDPDIQKLARILYEK